MRTDYRELLPYIDIFAQENLVKSKGRDMYNCPNCGSGTGPNSTGALKIYKDSNRFYCHACGINGNIFDLIGMIEGIDDFKDQIFRLEEIFHLNNLGHIRPLEKKNIKSKDKIINKEVIERIRERNRSYIKNCKLEMWSIIDKKIENKSYQHPVLDYLQYKRGIVDLETIEYFNLGFDSMNNRLVIPYNSYFYNSRTLSEKYAGMKYIKAKDSYNGVFNWNLLEQETIMPLFIVESELDAILLKEIGFEAIGLGGVQGKNKFLELLRIIKPRNPFIALGDNDDAGFLLEEDLNRELSNQGYMVLRAGMEFYFNCGSYKDLTEFYISEPTTVKERLELVFNHIKKLYDKENDSDRYIIY